VELGFFVHNAESGFVNKKLTICSYFLNSERGASSRSVELYHIRTRKSIGKMYKLSPANLGTMTKKKERGHFCPLSFLTIQPFWNRVFLVRQGSLPFLHRVHIQGKIPQ
jgi:hypothetical protein